MQCNGNAMKAKLAAIGKFWLDLPGPKVSALENLLSGPERVPGGKLFDFHFLATN